MRNHLTTPLKLLLLLLFVTILSACSGGTGKSVSIFKGLKMAPLDGMPADVLAAPAQVQQAYQFAAANPEVMQQVPCYCGCGDMGHTSNYACYVGGKNADGSLQFDTHALGCSICVDITQDTMRLLKEGKSVAEIKAYIDQTYAQFGPSNMP
jgi:Protein of unknown function with PCYCGC motif